MNRPFAPPVDHAPFRYLRCARCNVLQPPHYGNGGQRCVACGASLQRWVAYPPPGVPASATPPPPRPEPPYLGPPAYRGGHPRWSFAPMIWRELPSAEPQAADDPTGALRWAAALSALTSVIALVAAAAESWRFALMLEGRTLVLSGTVVRSSDLLVGASGLAVAFFALLTAGFVVPAVVRTHAAAAVRVGRAPSRARTGVLLRLLVPGWNIYGAGQIATEIDRTLAHQDLEVLPAGEADGTESTTKVPPRPPGSRLVTLWWLSWVASAALIIAALARGLGVSLQAIADTVQLHIAVDLMAAVVTGLGAAVLLRFARHLTDREPEYSGWVVAPPAPTRPIPPPSSPATIDRSPPVAPADDGRPA